MKHLLTIILTLLLFASCDQMEHTHNDFANSNHSHTEYAAGNHKHDEVAPHSHDLPEYEKAIRVKYKSIKGEKLNIPTTYKFSEYDAKMRIITSDKNIEARDNMAEVLPNGENWMVKIDGTGISIEKEYYVIYTPIDVKE